MSDARSDPGTPRLPWLPDVLKLGGRRLFVVLVGAALAVLAIRWLAHELSSFLTIILMALFLSFALEPAVQWLVNKGWKRGAATGLMLGLVFLSGVFLLALIVPAVVTGFKQLIENAPQLVDRLVGWLHLIGIKNVSTDNLITELQQNADKVVVAAQGIAGGLIIGVATSILGALFKVATVGLFTFYFVAEGPRLRRAILSMTPPDRQERLLFVWEHAIIQTGGYFYSRLLLAVINGTGMYIVLRANGVPFAAPLAIFEGIVAEFIPIIGTYIGGALPVLVAFLTSPGAGIWAAGYIVVYQQIENYILSPRLTAKTMSLHPAIAFAAALIGGAIGGLLAAFLALPVAGVLQAAILEYSKPYEVVAEPKEGLEVAAQAIEEGGGSEGDDHEDDAEP
ncbi:MAG TPA: AI-2E family transporter [Actinomycetota bacterium]|nr:AI-2E family transporter [Actinomycetota bacterium]